LIASSSSLLIRVMSLPSIFTSPAVGRCNPSIVRNNTDLPLPEPPTIPKTSPG
jgi:hypothetical protein